MQGHCSRSPEGGGESRIRVVRAPERPRMDVTVGRRERDALWELVFTLSASVGDIFSAVDAGRVSEARELRLRFWDLMRLLDDIGWAVEDAGEEYALTMEPEALMRALLHLQERASVLLRDHAEGAGSNRSCCERRQRAARRAARCSCWCRHARTDQRLDAAAGQARRAACRDACVRTAAVRPV